MTTVEKLLIQGVRSFSPGNTSVIEFFKPLTLIVGSNGSGKTTIIECLKYSCTGETPPNAGKRGQGFVHDPKVAMEREVKAQIKLRFRTSGGKPFVVTRSLCLTQKSAKQELKTLDSVIQTYSASGEKVSQSHRCAEIDKMVPQLMGVSKPILESVIFCHQEDSNWPLTEGAKLKARFDEIFSATRYTKALESVKKMRKEQASGVREMKVKVEAAGTVSQQAERVRVSREEHVTRAGQCDAECKGLETEIARMSDQVSKLREEVREAEAAASEVTMARAARDRASQSAEALRAQLKGREFPGSDDELAAAMKKVKRDLEIVVGDTSGVRERAKMLEERLVSVKREQEETSVELVHMQGAYRRCEQLRELRGKAVALVLSRNARLQLEDGRDADSAAAQLLRHAGEELASIEGKILTGKKAAVSARSLWDDKLASAAKEQSSLQERLKQKQSLLSEARSKLRNTENEIRESEKTMERVKSAGTELASAEEALGRLKSESLEASFDTRSAALNEEKKAVDAKLVELSGVIRRLSSLGEARAAIQMAASRRDVHRKTAEELLAACGDLRDGDPAIAVAACRADVVQETKAVQQCVKTVADATTKLVAAKEAQAKRDLAARKRARQLGDARVTEEALPEALRQCEQDAARLRKELALGSSAEAMYKKFLALASSSHCCPLCDRGFPDDAALSQFLASLGNIASAMPAAASTTSKTAELEASEARLVTLRGLLRAPSDLSSQDIASESQMSIGDLLKALADANAATREAEARAEKARASLDRVQDIARKRQEADKHFREADQAEEEMKELSAKLGEGSEASEADVRQEYEENLARNTELNQMADALRAEATNLAQRVSAQEARCLELRNVVNSISAVRSEYDRLQMASADFNNSVSSLVAELSTLEQSLASVDSSVKTLREESTTSARTHVEQEEVLRMERDSLKEGLSQLKTTHEQVMVCVKELGQTEERARSLEAKRASLVTEAEVLDADLREARKAAAGAGDALAQKELAMRLLQDTSRLRQALAELSDAQRELRVAEEKASSTPADASADKLAAIEDQLDALKAKREHSAGAQDELAAQIRQETAELARPLLAGAKEEHRRALIALRTTELALSDLDKYYKALDHSLMRYHVSKMENINRTIRELWQATYKSNDIDAIEIRSDAGDGAAAAGGASTVSYNYRVVMLKGDVELDMRGRCSAGQKVLASLIIRLALAETFCLNCGILALDEPTTNLDRANVESFANALVSLLRARRNQRGFQLIVITHDEEFVQLLGRSDSADYYWRVSKDERQHSTIVRQDIRDLA